MNTHPDCIKQMVKEYTEYIEESIQYRAYETAILYTQKWEIIIELIDNINKKWEYKDAG